MVSLGWLKRKLWVGSNKAICSPPKNKAMTARLKALDFSLNPIYRVRERLDVGAGFVPYNNLMNF